MLHIEDGVLVELTDGGAVATLHVVAIDFELRFGVYFCGVGGYDVAVGLISLHLARAFGNHDASGECAHGVAVEHIFKQLVA